MTMTAVYIDMLISQPSSGLRLHLSTIYTVLVPNTSNPRDYRSQWAQGHRAPRSDSMCLRFSKSSSI